MLAEEIGEGLVGELLGVLHSVFGEHVESVPGLVIKLNALPRAWSCFPSQVG
jgi:hypothetical protein